jgi:hypothetical protein
MAGYPNQGSVMSLNKKQFIDNIKEGSRKVSSYKDDLVIKQIEISSDGRKATVQTEGHEKGEMPFPGDDTQGPGGMPVEGVSICTQTITLGKNDTPQMSGANCSTSMEFLPFN